MMAYFVHQLFSFHPSKLNLLQGATCAFSLVLACTNDRFVQLGGLVTFWQVRVEVVLTLEYVDTVDLGINTQTKFEGHVNGFFVHDRQYTRQTQVDGAGLGVWFSTERRGRAGENFGSGCELYVNFQPDHCFPLHCMLPRYQALKGLALWKSVACWKRCAAFSRRPSSKWRPIICRPTGRPPTIPAGTDIPGKPARLTDSV